MNDYQVGPSNGYYHTRSWENGFYGQDDYRVNNRLTLNLGLRYDMYTWPTEINNRMANFDRQPGTLFWPDKMEFPTARFKIRSITSLPTSVSPTIYEATQRV